MKLKKMMFLRVLVAILYLAATVFVLMFIPDILRNLKGTNGEQFGAAIGLVILLVYGTIAYIPSFIFSIIGCIVSVIKYRRQATNKGTMVYFTVSILLEVVSVIGIILFVLLIA